MAPAGLWEAPPALPLIRRWRRDQLVARTFSCDSWQHVTKKCHAHACSFVPVYRRRSRGRKGRVDGKGKTCATRLTQMTLGHSDVSDPIALDCEAGWSVKCCRDLNSLWCCFFRFSPKESPMFWISRLDFNFTGGSDVFVGWFRGVGRCRLAQTLSRHGWAPVDCSRSAALASCRLTKAVTTLFSRLVFFRSCHSTISMNIGWTFEATHFHVVTSRCETWFAKSCFFGSMCQMTSWTPSFLALPSAGEWKYHRTLGEGTVWKIAFNRYRVHGLFLFFGCYPKKYVILDGLANQIYWFPMCNERVYFLIFGYRVRVK